MHLKQLFHPIVASLFTCFCMHSESFWPEVSFILWFPLKEEFVSLQSKETKQRISFILEWKEFTSGEFFHIHFHVIHRVLNFKLWAELLTHKP